MSLWEAHYQLHVVLQKTLFTHPHTLITHMYVVFHFLAVVLPSYHFLVFDRL